MHSKRFLCLTLSALLLGGNALAGTEELSGSVVAGYAVSVTAPFGGTVASASAREGQWINEGDALASILTTRVVATTDGTVRGIYAVPGDSVDGTVLGLSPVSKYTVSADNTDAYPSVSTKRVTLGETLYLKCARDGSHRAVGRVIAVNGSAYTVETTGGELYLEETVYLYRDAQYASATRVGSGTVARTALVSIAGSGSVVRMHVEDGEEVERGQLLFETVEGTLDAYAAVGSEILSTVSGVLTKIAPAAGNKLLKGDAVATIAPRDGYQLAVTVPEDMISLIAVGDRLRFYLDWDEQTPRWYEGTVASLSYVSTVTAGDTTTFTAYLDFEADETVRLGMSAVVELET